ncbi:MAG TPA: sodium:solute symporter, partial [Vicinamibacteria bacterium]|nr:sodium:solute symporter [Vicinamibacteria bacterium]
STRSPKDASLMNMWVNVVLIFPRYFMISGLTVLALVFYSDTVRGMGSNIDFEMILPEALARFVPAGLLGLLIAGLLAAFMSNFAATVNAAPPYIVNDIYRRFINPHASEKTYVRMSYAASLGVVIAGISVGWFVESINDVIQWITAALWGGYTAANVLKWYWWRFNGYGYFWGMVAGIGASLLLAAAQALRLTGLSALNAFPLILAVSMLGCFVATWLTPAEDEQVLKSFYRQVRPWGFWGPILAKVRQEDPAFERNTDFGRDMFNIAVGIAWQTSLVLIPICLVIRRFGATLIAAAVVVIGSIVLKLTWYDHLDVREARGKAVAST